MRNEFESNAKPSLSFWINQVDIYKHLILFPYKSAWKGLKIKKGRKAEEKKSYFYEGRFFK